MWQALEVLVSGFYKAIYKKVNTFQKMANFNITAL